MATYFRGILFLFLGFCTLCGWAQTGIITTVAGTGYPRDTGNGGPATAAGVAEPTFTMAIDTAGNLYFAQRFNHTVRKISHSGIISNFAGTGVVGYSGDGGASMLAQLDNPYGISADSQGNVYIAEDEGSRIRKVDHSTFEITTVAGNGNLVDSGDGGQATSAGVGAAIECAFDRVQNMYISYDFYRVRKVDVSTGIISTVAGRATTGGFSGDGGPATSAEFYQIHGICTDINNNLYIADWGNARVRRVDASTGTITTIAGNGTAAYNGEGLAATATQLGPFGIKMDHQGNLIIADRNNFRVRKLTPGGVIYTIAGTGTAGFSGDGGPATAAMINRPNGIAIDECDNVFIADNSNYRIRKVTFPGNDKPSITITASSGNRLCYGMPVTFRASTARGGRAPVYQWKVNGTSVGASAPTYTYTPANGDSVQCVLTSNSYCVVNPMDTSNTLYMSVGTLAPPVVAISGISSANTGSLVTLTAAITGSSGAYTLQWANHGTTFATTAVPTVTYTKPAGNDTITATLVSMGKGCYDSVVSNAHVVKDPHLGVPGANAATKEVLCYPNPVADALHIASEQVIAQVTITDMLGRVVYSGPHDGKQVTINVSQLGSGIYFVKTNGVFTGRFNKL